MKKWAILLLAGCMLTVVFCSCDIVAPNMLIAEDIKESKSDEELIKDCILSFVNSYNTGDYQTMISCFDKKTRNRIEMSDKILWNVFSALDDNYANGLFATLMEGIEYEDIWEYSVGVVGADGDMMAIDITHIDIQDDRSATVTANISFDLDMPIYVFEQKQKIELAQSQEVNILMVMEDGEWFLQNIIEK